jgi:peroxisomal enoyl-CoA hydratase 2
MSGPGAGFEYPPVEVAWLKRDVLLFANSIGCTTDELHFLFVCLRDAHCLYLLKFHLGIAPKFCCLPYISNYSTFISTAPLQPSIANGTPAFKQTTQEIIDFYKAQGATPIPGVPKFDARRVVDGQRLMTFLKPFPTTSKGRTFELRSKVIGVYDKGKAGSVVETQQDIVDKATGESYARAVGSAFFVGQGNWGGPKGPATENFPPPQGKKPDAVVSHQTTPESALLYRYEHYNCLLTWILKLKNADSTVITILSMPRRNQDRRWASAVQLCMVSHLGILLPTAS